MMLFCLRFQTIQFSISTQFKCQNSPISSNSVHLMLNDVILFKVSNNSVFANGPRDLGSIPGRVIPKTFKNGT